VPFQINRDLLDFDFEKVCSVSLSNTNVYCCLVDGKYFQGRGKNSWAYKHSVSEGKHVFLKLDTEEVRPRTEHRWLARKCRSFDTRWRRR
jgi:hypothetical protein